MEGMAVNLRPSRPEITDVVNAVYDGADGIVLMQVGGWVGGSVGGAESGDLQLTYTHVFSRVAAHANLSQHRCSPTHCFDSQETSTGRFAGHCVRTTSQIICDAEAGMSHSANYTFIRSG